MVQNPPIAAGALPAELAHEPGVALAAVARARRRYQIRAPEGLHHARADRAGGRGQDQADRSRLAGRAPGGLSAQDQHVPDRRRRRSRTTTSAGCRRSSSSTSTSGRPTSATCARCAGTYPSPIDLRASVLGGSLDADGHADFFAKPYPTLDTDFDLRKANIVPMAPMVRRFDLVVSKGMVGASGRLVLETKQTTVDLDARGAVRAVDRVRARSAPGASARWSRPSVARPRPRPSPACASTCRTCGSRTGRSRSRWTRCAAHDGKTAVRRREGPAAAPARGSRPPRHRHQQRAAPRRLADALRAPAPTSWATGRSA